ncbi:MAG TPA: hypothetical protein VGL72_15180 [Bryobacteraceae bacterium]
MLIRLLALWAGSALTCWAAAAPLKIIHIGIHQIEDGPAVADRVGFVPGETIYLSFDVENYSLTKEQGTAVSWVVEATDPKGVPIVPPAEGKKQATLQAEDKNWLPRARQAIILPTLCTGGLYSIHIKVTDQNSKDTAEADTKFKVSGPELPATPELVIRSFAFFRTEEDPKPLQSPTYRSGDSMYARFQIAGYKYGPGNAIDASYGISILGPAGNVMYTQDPASEEKSASFYPKPYFDASMSLSLNAGTKAGDYTLVITAKDKVGSQTAEARKTFHVE